MALATAPGAIGAGLMSRSALADCHEELAVLREIRPDNWAILYEEPLDIGAFQAAYRIPSRDNTEMLIQQHRNAISDNDEEITLLVSLIDNLFDSGRKTLMDVRESVSEIVNDVSEGINGVADAIGVIALGALDAAHSLYENLDLDVIRRWVAQHVVLAIEGVVTMDSLLKIVGRNPIKHPLALVAGALIYAVFVTTTEPR